MPFAGSLLDYTFSILKEEFVDFINKISTISTAKRIKLDGLQAHPKEKSTNYEKQLISNHIFNSLV